MNSEEPEHACNLASKRSRIDAGKGVDSTDIQEIMSSAIDVSAFIPYESVFDLSAHSEELSATTDAFNEFYAKFLTEDSIIYYESLMAPQTTPGPPTTVSQNVASGSNVSLEFFSQPHPSCTNLRPRSGTKRKRQDSEEPVHVCNPESKRSRIDKGKGVDRTNVKEVPTSVIDVSKASVASEPIFDPSMYNDREEVPLTTDEIDEIVAPILSNTNTVPLHSSMAPQTTPSSATTAVDWNPYEHLIVSNEFTPYPFTFFDSSETSRSDAPFSGETSATTQVPWLDDDWISQFLHSPSDPSFVSDTYSLRDDPQNQDSSTAPQTASTDAGWDPYEYSIDPNSFTPYPSIPWSLDL